MSPEAALDSFFADSASRQRQTRHATSLVAGWRGRQGTLALVTHAFNIQALTGISPQEAEVVVLRPRTGGFDVVGRWQLRSE